MQELKNIIKKISKKTKKFYKEDILSDIIIIGSSLKDKKKPNDIDFMIILNYKKYEKIEKLIPKIRDELSIEIPLEKIHISPIYTEDLFTEKIFQAILHEGFSLKHNRYISELIGFNSQSLFSFSLDNLSNSKKVQFSYALHGRNKDGLLEQEKGKSLGKGVFIIPIIKEELFKELLKKWNIKYKLNRIFINN